ncbi:MAG TPA: TIGR03790 family protein [Acidobacteriaceae bacterium]|nr:TIGR03790 family protein [Acidobacteriaceae bacterium]
MASPLLLAAGLALGAVSARAHTAREVLVVYNADSPVSTAIAKDYAAQRNVHQLLAIRCADSAVSTANETILLEDYTRQIEQPVASYLDAHPQINFLVLTKGVPIRVRGAKTGSRDESDATAPLNASVDSYLAALEYAKIPGAVKIAIHGSGARGYGWLNRYWKQDKPFSHAEFGGYLVTRLDGYTQADAESLVNRAISGERAVAKPGQVLLDVQPVFKFKPEDVPAQPLAVTGDIPDESDYGSWDADMVKAAGELKRRAVPVELDQNEAFVGGRTNLLGYFSWGSNDPKYTAEAYKSLRFAPGSISDTAVSTSARTFLPTTGGQSLIADLIPNGITGIKGYTDEPLLQAIASPSVALDRYFSGFTLAESFYAASRFVGWTDVVIGDPLARAPKNLRK